MRRAFASAATDAFDYVVIGGGSGGIASARRAAQHGAKVAVIEGSKLGGTCVNVGCVPKKVMWHAAELGAAVGHASEYGWQGVGAPTMDLAMLKSKRDAYVQRLNGIYARNLEASGVTSISGWGSLVGEGRVAVRGADGATHEVSGKNVLLAPGGKPWVPAEPWAAHSITSDEFFDLDTVPKHAVVVGGGYIGCELAGILASLGSKVTMVIRGGCPLRGFDSLVVDTVMAAMVEAGVDVKCESNIVDASGDKGDLTLALDNGSSLSGVDCLLMATGRVPFTDGLGLDTVGAELLPSGAVKTDAGQTTSLPWLHAVGDVTGHAQLTPVAIAAGRLLADRLFGGYPHAKLEYENIPTVMFTHPPIGTIGLTEEAAVERFGADAVQTFTSTFASLFFGIMEHKGKTAMKLVTTGPEQRIVGLHVAGQGADEMLQGFAVAVKMGATKADFDSVVAIHPTSAEEFVTMQPWAPHSRGDKSATSR